MVVLDPLPNPREVVLVEESHAVGLQRMAEIHRRDGIEFSVSLVQEHGLAQDGPAIDARLLQSAFRNHLLADKDASGK